MIEPIRPSDVINSKKYLVPDEIIEAFNEIVEERYDLESGEAVFQYDEVMCIIVSKTGTRYTSSEIDKWILSVEEVFVEWDVKVGVTEDAYLKFTFTPRSLE